MPQTLLQLGRHEVLLACPLAQALSDQDVREALKLLILVLHLVVLGVEDDALLYLLHILASQLVVADAHLLNAEVRLEGVSNGVAACLRNSTVEYL